MKSPDRLRKRMLLAPILPAGQMPDVSQCLIHGGFVREHWRRTMGRRGQRPLGWGWVFCTACASISRARCIAIRGITPTCPLNGRPYVPISPPTPE
jgi:hypothetical protein